MFLKETFARPGVRLPYSFGDEKVHIGIIPAKGDPDPRYECDRCHQSLSESEFAQVSFNRNVPKRISRIPYVTILHPVCNKCQTQERGQWASHELYSQELDSFCQKLTIGARGGAVKRKILFAITKDDVLGMYLKQQGICAISGLEMDWKEQGQKGRNAKNYKRPSIDRISSSGNYVIGNVHLTMSIVNIMKNDLPLDVFKEMCRQIALQN